MSIQSNEWAIPAWTIGDRLRKAREVADLTQSELAERIGVSRRSITSYEAGGTPKRPVLLSWSLATGVPVEWLLTGEAPHPHDPGTPRDMGNQTSPCIIDFPRRSLAAA